MHWKLGGQTFCCRARRPVPAFLHLRRALCRKVVMQAVELHTCGGRPPLSCPALPSGGVSRPRSLQRPSPQRGCPSWSAGCSEALQQTLVVGCRDLDHSCTGRRAAPLQGQASAWPVSTGATMLGHRPRHSPCETSQCSRDDAASQHCCGWFPVQRRPAQPRGPTFAADAKVRQAGQEGVVPRGRRLLGLGRFLAFLQCELDPVSVAC